MRSRRHDDLVDCSFGGPIVRIVESGGELGTSTLSSTSAPSCSHHAVVRGMIGFAYRRPTFFDIAHTVQAPRDILSCGGLPAWCASSHTLSRSRRKQSFRMVFSTLEVFTRYWRRALFQTLSCMYEGASGPPSTSNVFRTSSRPICAVEMVHRGHQGVREDEEGCMVCLHLVAIFSG